LDLNYLTAYNLKKRMESGQISCLDIAESVFSRIEDIDGTVNAYIRVEKENAFKEAKKVDKRLSSGEKIEDFTGIPVGIKDNICTEGITTTCASKILEKYVLL